MHNEALRNYDSFIHSMAFWRLAAKALDGNAQSPETRCEDRKLGKRHSFSGLWDSCQGEDGSKVEWD